MDDKTNEYETLPAPFLILTICLGAIGIFTNGYSLHYMKWNFNTSRLIYKLLMFSCIVTLVECFLEVTMASILLKTKDNLVCMIFQIAYVVPKFIVNSIILQISLLRCIVDWLTNSKSFLPWFYQFQIPLDNDIFQYTY